MVRHGFGLPRDVFDRYATLFGVETIRRLHVERRPGVTTLAACAAQWRMDQWYGGRPVPTQAIAMVAVDPALRGQGVGTDLMRAVLEEGRSNGAALAVLCPSTLPLYQRIGFGRGGVACDWSAPPVALGDASDWDVPDSAITPADPLDAAPLARLRRALLAANNGLAERNEALWTLALCPDGEPAELFLLNGPDGPEGYVALLPPKDRRLVVADLCAPTGRSIRLAMRLLTSYRAQIDRIVWRGGPDDPLALLAQDVGVQMNGREEWLARVLDVRQALTIHTYPNDIETSLTFAISDPIFPENCGNFHLQVAGGRGVIAICEKDKAASATLGIAAFSSLFTGHASARTLSQTGLLYGKEMIIDILGRLYCGARPWMVDRF